MRPVRIDVMNLVYKGHGEVGDLWVYRYEPGHVMAVFELDEEEQTLIAKGGRVVLHVLTEPIPPVALTVMSEEDTHPIEDHPYKVIPELDDPERQ